MKRFIFTFGPSASGKSTWAHQFPADISLVISRDEIRETLDLRHGEDERRVTRFMALAILSASDKPFVVVHDTNVSRAAILNMIQWSKGRELYVKDFSAVPYDECVRRDSTRQYGSVGPEVIAHQFDMMAQIRPSIHTIERWVS